MAINLTKMEWGLILLTGFIALLVGIFIGATFLTAGLLSAGGIEESQIIGVFSDYISIPSNWENPVDLRQECGDFLRKTGKLLSGDNFICIPSWYGPLINLFGGTNEIRFRCDCYLLTKCPSTKINIGSICSTVI